MPQTLRPLGDRVLVRRHEEKTANKSGLLMPAGATEKPVEGTIVAVGKGRKLDNGSVLPVDLEPGQHVLFGKYAGSEVRVNGETLMLMREDEVMGEVLGEADPEALSKNHPGCPYPVGECVCPIEVTTGAKKSAKKRRRK